MKPLIGAILIASSMPANSTSIDDVTLLLDWAERAYPQFFREHQKNLTSPPYVYRYYPDTGNYVGVAGSSVFILGPVAGGGTSPAYVGEIESFRCNFRPGTCEGWPTINVAAPLQALNAGSKLVLNANIEGKGPYSVQWYRKGVMLDGQHSPTLTIEKVDASDAGPYHVLVTNGIGAAYSDWIPVTVNGRSDDTARSGRISVFNRYGGAVEFPAASQSWEVVYKFKVPQLPAGRWSAPNDTFYVWGDLQLDHYGSDGPYTIAPYKYIQFVPALLLGNSLSENNANYIPRWNWLPVWNLQAQYYWQKGESTYYAQTGRLVQVRPGEQITTTMKYDAGSGAIFISIAALSGESTITVDRPFPNEPALFSSWRKFFEVAQAKSGKLLIAPVMSVEPSTDKQTVCSILPFEIDFISVPGLASTASQFVQGTPGGMPCNKPMVRLNF